jgi:hypothetical protein
LPATEELLKLVVEKVQSGMMPATVDEKRRYLHNGAHHTLMYGDNNILISIGHAGDTNRFIEIGGYPT